MFPAPIHRESAGGLKRTGVVDGRGKSWQGTGLELEFSRLMKYKQHFPGGAVVKNLPANAGDMGSSPGPGRSHMLRSN